MKKMQEKAASKNKSMGKTDDPDYDDANQITDNSQHHSTPSDHNQDVQSTLADDQVDHHK